MDEDTCMVSVTRDLLDYLSKESCGKCVPCREGIRQMHKILTNITEGRGKEGDIQLLERITDLAGEAALCSLGRTAPAPFLSALRYFRDEFEAHIQEKRCPVLFCNALKMQEL
jgi:NADH-quinone oxidoreductase subunit F